MSGAGRESPHNSPAGMAGMRMQGGARRPEPARLDVGPALPPLAAAGSAAMLGSLSAGRERPQNPRAARSPPPPSPASTRS